MRVLVAVFALAAGVLAGAPAASAVPFDLTRPLAAPVGATPTTGGPQGTCPVGSSVSTDGAYLLVAEGVGDARVLIPVDARTGDPQAAEPLPGTGPVRRAALAPLPGDAALLAVVDDAGRRLLLAERSAAGVTGAWREIVLPQALGAGAPEPQILVAPDGGALVLIRAEAASSGQALGEHGYLAVTRSAAGVVGAPVVIAAQPGRLLALDIAAGGAAVLATDDPGAGVRVWRTAAGAPWEEHLVPSSAQVFGLDVAAAAGPAAVAFVARDLAGASTIVAARTSADGWLLPVSLSARGDAAQTSVALEPGGLARVSWAATGAAGAVALHEVRISVAGGGDVEDLPLGRPASELGTIAWAAPVAGLPTPVMPGAVGVRGADGRLTGTEPMPVSSTSPVCADPSGAVLALGGARFMTPGLSPVASWRVAATGPFAAAQTLASVPGDPAVLAQRDGRTLISWLTADGELRAGMATGHTTFTAERIGGASTRVLAAAIRPGGGALVITATPRADAPATLDRAMSLVAAPRPVERAQVPAESPAAPVVPPAAAGASVAPPVTVTAVTPPKQKDRPRGPLRLSRFAVRQRRVVATLRCSRACTLRLQVTVRVDATGPWRVDTTRRISLPGGRTQTVAVTLSRRTRAALRANRRVALRITTRVVLSGRR